MERNNSILDACKLQIRYLDDKNWITWKYRMCILLRGAGVIDVVEGKVVKPDLLKNDATAEDIATYNSRSQSYQQADSTALLILTSNMSEENLHKIIRFRTSKEVWDELHRIFDGISEDKAYDLCMKLFSYKKHSEDVMSAHLSKMKNLWYDLNQEMMKSKGDYSELPELLLICKILETLPDEYFTFKSSWMLMSKGERTIGNLTSQLCAHERALTCKSGETSMEALTVKKNIIKRLTKSSKDLF